MGVLIHILALPPSLCVRELPCWTSVNTGRVSLSLKKTKNKQTSRGRKKQKEKEKDNLK
jgi:hypothetical protein